MTRPLHTPYRGRLAPSPTGYLHVGHARTFWAAHERARAARGVLVMRVEDLDEARSRPEFAEASLEDLRWLGVEWQEGPDVGGPFAPYVQSERRGFYLEAWARLVAGGFVYPCSCSRRDIARAAEAPHEGAQANASQNAQDDEPVYPGTCRPRAGEATRTFESPAGLNWRFRGARNVPARAGACVDVPARDEPRPRFEVETASRALRVRRERAAHIRPLLPLYAEPAQVFEHRFRELRARARRVQIFDAHDERASRRARPLVRGPERARVAEVHEARRRRREPAAV